MYAETLKELGLAKNEGFIYVSLVKHGGMGIASIALKSGVHRRNVYDSMQRLLEKGLVYEEIGDKENVYFAIDPHKLLEIVEEKRLKVEMLIPDLLRQFKSSTNEQNVTIYRGVEGVKNYILLLEREAKEIYLYGALGGSLSPKVSHIFKRLVTMLERKKIPANVLYSNCVLGTTPEVVGHMGKTSKNKILSKDFDGTATYTVFGEYVCFQSGQYSLDNINEGGEIMLFIIKSKPTADMMKKMFQTVWNISAEEKTIKK